MQIRDIQFEPGFKNTEKPDDNALTARLGITDQLSRTMEDTSDLLLIFI